MEAKKVAGSVVAEYALSCIPYQHCPCPPPNRRCDSYYDRFSTMHPGYCINTMPGKYPPWRVEGGLEYRFGPCPCIPNPNCPYPRPDYDFYGKSTLSYVQKEEKPFTFASVNFGEGAAAVYLGEKAIDKLYDWGQSCQNWRDSTRWDAVDSMRRYGGWRITGGN